MNMTKTIKILSLIIIALFVLASCGGGSSSGKVGAGKLALKISFEDSTRTHKLSKVEGLSSVTLTVLPKNSSSYTPSVIDLMPYYSDNASTSSLTINNLTDGETYYVQIRAYDNSSKMTYYGSNSVVIQPGVTNGVEVLAKINTGMTFENSLPTFTATKKTVNGQEWLDLSVSGGGVTEVFVTQSSNTGSFIIDSSDTDNGSSVSFSSNQALKNDGKHSDGSANDNLWNQRYSFTTLNIGDTFNSVLVFTNVFGQLDIASMTTAVVAGSSASTSTISGIVTWSGVGLSGVTMHLTGAATTSTTADANGNYSFSGAADGSYTVMPSLTGYTFSPTSISVNVSGANVTGQNFTATSSGSVERLLLTISDAGATNQPPMAPTIFTLDNTSMITRIQTYHYNLSLGFTPGTIGLKASDNTTLGPWQAVGELNNWYWTVTPNIVIAPGTYLVLDSSPATWSFTDPGPWGPGTNGMGFVWVYGY